MLGYVESIFGLHIPQCIVVRLLRCGQLVEFYVIFFDTNTMHCSFTISVWIRCTMTVVVYIGRALYHVAL